MNEQFMREAVDEARLAIDGGNWGIGCVIVLHGKIIARAHNLVYSTNNRFAHAEMQALQAANDLLIQYPNEATLYTTYEPCPMCFGACITGKVKKVVCGVNLDDSGAMYLRENLPTLFKLEKFKVEFEQGVLSYECAEVFLEGKPAKDLIMLDLIKADALPDGLEHVLKKDIDALNALEK